MKTKKHTPEEIMYQRCIELFDINNVKELILSTAKIMLTCGAVDCSSHLDYEYRLPKTILCAAMKRTAESFRPFGDDMKEITNNLEEF